MGTPDGPVSGSQLAPANTPAAIAQGLAAQGMDQGGNFTPGRPLNPYFGYSTAARGTDYPVGVNIATQGRAAWNRPSFDTLKAVIDGYDVARMCINHKIDELRSMELMFQPADGVKDDVEDAIDAARLVLAYPDRELPYEAWFSKWMENVWKYDNAPLYKRRDGNGDVIALEVVDGKTVHPYIDANGRRPMPPAPMAWQVVHGMVGTWFTRDDLIYVPFRPQEDSPYGLAPIESILLTANTDIRFQWHFLQMFTDGSVPAGFMELPPDISQPQQVREWQDYWDAMVMGDQAKLHQLLAVPNGSKFTGTKPAAFDPTFVQYLMRRTCAAHGVVPQDLGFIEDVNRANGETQVDIQFRVNTLPSVLFVNGILTRYLQKDIGLPVKVSLDTGRDKEDRLAEAQAHQLYVDMGAESPDEVRVDVLGKAIDKERPVGRFYSTPRLGPIPLTAIAAVAGQIDPDTYGPTKDQPPLPFTPAIGVVPPADTGAGTQAGRVQQEPEAPAQASSAEQQPEKPDEDVRKAVLSGAEAVELAAFREFVTGSRRRGRWRDFVFKTVSPAIAAELNRGGRAEVGGAALKAKADGAAKNTPGLTKRSGMISLDLPPGTVPTLPGGVDDHHITIVYLGSDVDDDAYAEACARAGAAAASMTGPLIGTVAGIGSFEPSAGSDGLVPAWAAVSVPGVHDLNSALSDLSTSEHRDYHPHVTLAYVQPGEPLPDPVPVAPVTFTHLSVHRGSDVTRIPLGPRDSATVAKADADPKDQAPPQGPESAQQWPGWQYDLAAAVYWAPLVAMALGGAFDAEVLAHAFLASHTRSAAPAGESDDEREQRLQAAAAQWLEQYRSALQRELRTVVPGILADGYAIGTASATAVMDAGERGRQEAAAEIAADMADWHPGNYEAAMLLIGRDASGSGVRDLLDKANVQIKSIADTRLNDLGRLLAVGAARGDSADTIARDIRDLLTAPWRAHMVASTELARAVSAAAVDGYQARGYREIEWLDAGDTHVCPQICEPNAEHGPVRIGEPFPSGAFAPPGHPECRCAPGVVISSRRQEGE